MLDEAQNATTMQMKMFLTRMGEGSRMAITGDTSQIDLPRGVPSGLIEAKHVLRKVKVLDLLNLMLLMLYAILWSQKLFERMMLTKKKND